MINWISTSYLLASLRQVDVHLTRWPLLPSPWRPHRQERQPLSALPRRLQWLGCALSPALLLGSAGINSLAVAIALYLIVAKYWYLLIWKAASISRAGSGSKSPVRSIAGQSGSPVLICEPETSPIAVNPPMPSSSLSLSLCLQRRRRLSACRTFLHFQELPLVNRDTL